MSESKFTININRTVGNVKFEPNGKDIIEERTERVNKFCEMLFIDNNNFDKLKTFEYLFDYIDKYNRILYAPISTSIYACYNEHEAEEVEKLIGNMITNVQAIVDYTYSNEYKANEKIQNKKRKAYYDTKKAIIKIWDHINLAQMQYSTLKQTDEEYKKKFNDSVEPIKSDISKELSSQLLTMVSIFTALSFLIFGGISSLENIFSNPKLPLFKLMIVGCIWGLCILNLVFVFLFCVGKMTKLNFKSTQIKEASIIKKYPIVWFCNFVIISILIISIWAYYLTKKEIHTWLDRLCLKNPICSSMIGTLIIIGVILFVGYKLMKEIKYTNGSEE